MPMREDLDEVIAYFTVVYGDQNEKDYRRLLEANSAGPYWPPSNSDTLACRLSCCPAHPDARGLFPVSRW